MTVSNIVVMDERERKRDRQTKERSRIRTNGDDALDCPICGERAFRNLGLHVTRVHGLSCETFRERYPGRILESPTLTAIRADITRDRNDARGWVLHWTTERCVAAIRRFYRRNGRPPTINDLERLSRPGPAGFTRRRKTYPTPRTIQKRFGSFNAGVEAAGLVPLPRGGLVQEACMHGHSVEDTIVRSDGRRECGPCARRRDRVLRGAADETFCSLCGATAFRMLSMHLRRAHGLSLEDAARLHPGVLEGGTCRNGHPLTLSKTLGAQMVCVACKREGGKRHYAKHRERIRAQQNASRNEEAA